MPSLGVRTFGFGCGSAIHWSPGFWQIFIYVGALLSTCGDTKVDSEGHTRAGSSRNLTESVVFV